MRMPLSDAGGRGGVARVAALQHRRARHGRERVARVVIAVFRVLQRVEHLGAVGDRAADDAAPVAIDVGADRAAVEAEHRLVRQDQRQALWLAGPRVEARVSSPRLAITRLALTDTAEPDDDPSEAARVVS